MSDNLHFDVSNILSGNINLDPDDPNQAAILDPLDVFGTRSKIVNEQAIELEKRRADIRAARERTKQVRTARRLKSEALTQAQAGAGTGGSGLSGTQANINSQLAGNIKFLEDNRGISAQLSDLNIKSAEISQQSQTGKAVTQNLFGF